MSSKYSKLPPHVDDTLVSDPIPLIPLQQKAYDSVFKDKQNYSQLHSYNPKSIKQGAIRRTSETPRGSKTVVIPEVSQQTCPSGISPDFDVVNKNGKRVKLVPFIRYLYETRNTYCKNKKYPNYVWDATIDKYCCSESPEDILTRLNHLLDALENGVGNVNINSSVIDTFDEIKNEINKIFKFLFPDDSGFGDEINNRNLDIRRKVEEKLDSLISENDTGLPLPTMPLPTMPLSPAFIHWFSTYVDLAQMQNDPENFPDISDISDPQKARKIATVIEIIASKGRITIYTTTPPTAKMKETFIRDVLSKLPDFNPDLDYRSPAWTEDIPPTTTKMANAIWDKRGGRQYHLKKKYKSKSKSKSKSNSKVNTKNTRRIRRKS